MALITQPKHITKEELHTLARVTNDPFFFSTFVYVIHPIRGKVQFALYPFQKAVLYQFVKERFNIVLKFRQAGITELISMYCLWLCMYHPNKKVNIISIKDTTAKKVLKKIKFMYKNLPPYLQTPIINGRPTELGSSSMMEFSNGSFIESVPTSPEAGRSESLTLLVIDEAAMVRWANEVWAAALPTLSCSVGSTPLFTRKYIQVREGVTKPITNQVKLRELCPKYKGVIDISSLGLYTLTHTGKWQKILKSQNKGKLETWFVKDNRGKKGGYTPAHRLYTTKGWKTLAEIIENDLNVIQVDTKVDELRKPSITTPPSEEILKPIREFPWYSVSNLGRVFDSNMKEVPQRLTKDGYMRVALRNPNIKRITGSINNQKKSKTYQRSLHRLVAEAFIGEIQNGYQVDHIDCNRTCNHVNNLRYIPVSDNVTRSYKHNLSACLSSISGNRLADLDIRGRLLEMYEQGYSYREIAKELYPDCKQGHKFVKRILNERGSRVYISKLKVVKKTYRTIYDIEVENDHSYISATNFVNHNTGGAAIINSCITGDTEIIGRHGNFRVEQVCPKEFGVQDISFMNIEVLTHKLQWRKALYGVNKGILETWEIENDHGDIIKCTPAHKFLTPKGWLPASKCIEHHIPVIRYDPGEKSLTQAVSNQSCKKIELDYELSYLKCNRVFSENIYDITVEGDESYITTSNYISHNTPKGIGNFYHSQWADSISGGNGFNPIRLYWNMHPERDDAWYYRMSKALGPRRTAQEIDGDFLSSGNTVFDLADIKAIEDCLSDYPVIKVRFNGQYRQFLEPDPEKKYYIGADVATGRGSDYSSFTCMDRHGEEHVVYKGRISVDKFAKLLGDTGELYNYALIAPESNDVGLAVTSMLQTEGYPNLYYYQKLIKQKGKSRPEVDKAPGWLTTNKNRSVIIEALEKDIREGNVIIKDPFFVNEAYTFIYDGLNRPVAMGKHKANTNADDIDAEVYSDDDIFGKAITNHIRKGKEQIILLPQ